MKLSREKFKFSMGLGFGEERDMKMLSSMAAKGWIFYKYQGLGYKFKKGEPQDLIYNFDSVRISENDKLEYLEVFEAAGWNNVCSYVNLFHFFSAKPGTAQIYSYKHTKEERNNRGIKDILKGIGGLVLFATILVLVHIVLKRTFDNDLLNIITSAGIGGSIGLISMSIISGLFMKFKKRKV